MIGDFFKTVASYAIEGGHQVYFISKLNLEFKEDNISVLGLRYVELVACPFGKFDVVRYRNTYGYELFFLVDVRMSPMIHMDFTCTSIKIANLEIKGVFFEDNSPKYIYGPVNHVEFCDGSIYSPGKKVIISLENRAKSIINNVFNLPKGD